MGCATGEIELGFSTDEPPVRIHVIVICLSLSLSLSLMVHGSFFKANLQPEIQSWFSANLSEQIPSSSVEIPSIADPSREAIQISSHQILPAFTRYEAALSPVVAAPTRNPSLFARAISFFRNLNMRQTTHEFHIHHVIAERRRREKQNKSFQVLRTLLPQVSKAYI